MLPQPSTARPPKRSYAPLGTTFAPSTLAATGLAPATLLPTLRARARLTNLAALLLIGALALSALLNLVYVLSPALAAAAGPRRLAVVTEGWDDHATLAQLTSGRPLSIETTLDRPAGAGELDHLVMVPGHAIWVGHDAQRARDTDADWVLEPMQRGGSVRTFVKHIEHGVDVLGRDPRALLVFSGGATRPPPSPPLPEGQSYHHLATELALLPSTPVSAPADWTGAAPPLPLDQRATTEEYALDSYENLLFSVARFREFTGRWPARITVVGYGMKRRRFELLHRAAIRFPLDAFDYVGIDDEGDTTEHYAGELKYGFTPFLSTPSGCHPPLSIKRQLRNPFARYHPYHTSAPELVPLLEWCPPTPAVAVAPDDVGAMRVFGGPVPWDAAGAGGAGGGRPGFSREKD